MPPPVKRVFVFEYFSTSDAAPDAALCAAGRTMRDALVADLCAGPQVQVCVACRAGDDQPPSCATSVARQACEPAPDFVAREARRHDYSWIVAPETGGLLAAFARAVEPARWLGATLEAIVLASSKHATLERLGAVGIPTPHAVAASRRWVVKPDDGAGACDTRVHRDRAGAQADLDARRAAGQTATLEPWVEGDARSLTLLCAPNSVELLCVNRQAITLRADGAVEFHGVTVGALPAEPALTALARDVVLAIPGLRGLIGIDYVQHAALGPVIIEVNPRMTTACVSLSSLLARNVAAEVLTVLAAESLHD